MPLYDITFWPTLYRLADCFHMSVSVGFGRGLSAALHLCHAPVEFSPEDDAHCKTCLLSLLDKISTSIASTDSGDRQKLIQLYVQ